MDDGTAAEQVDDEEQMNAISGGRPAQWFDHLINGLTLIGITALVAVTWRLSDSVARLETAMTAKGTQDDREFARIDGTLQRHDQRLTDLERGQGARFPDSDNRQKRQ